MLTSLNGESMKLRDNRCNHTLILLNRNSEIYIQISHMVNLARAGERARARFGILNSLLYLSKAHWLLHENYFPEIGGGNPKQAGFLFLFVFCFVMERKNSLFPEAWHSRPMQPKESRVRFRGRWNPVWRTQASALSCQGSIAVCGPARLLEIVAKVKHLQPMS